MTTTVHAHVHVHEHACIEQQLDRFGVTIFEYHNALHVDHNVTELHKPLNDALVLENGFLDMEHFTDIYARVHAATICEYGLKLRPLVDICELYLFKARKYHPTLFVELLSPVKEEAELLEFLQKLHPLQVMCVSW